MAARSYGGPSPCYTAARVRVDRCTSCAMCGVQLDADVELDQRPEYHRAVLDWLHPVDGVPLAVSTGNQLSSRLLSMRAANALLKLPAASSECHRLNKGELVDAVLISQL